MHVPKVGELVYIKNLNETYNENDYPYFESFGLIQKRHKTVPNTNNRSYFNFLITEPKENLNLKAKQLYPKVILTWKLVRTISFEKLKLLVRKWRIKLLRKLKDKENLAIIYMVNFSLNKL